jgi:hypothetical protein
MLTINAAYASQFNESSQRAQSQRKAALVSSTAVPQRVVGGLLASLREPLRSSPAPLRSCSPLLVVAHIFRLHRLTIGDDITAEQRAALASPPPMDPALLACLAAFLDTAGPGRAAVAKLLRWARGRAHTEKLKAAAAREELARAAAASAARAAPARAAPEALNEEGMEVAAAAAAAAVTVAAPAPAAAALLPPQRSAPLPAVSRKRKGRGCGQGRGLGPAGEPEFRDLHPSWKARRTVASRQRKAIHKDLHRLQDV